MRRPLCNKYFAGATLIVAAFIIYGSLFPFAFQARGGAGPLATLLAHWRARPEHFGNAIGNIFLYLPLGLCGVLALGPRAKTYVRFGAAVALGTALCFAMELTQFYEPGRDSTFADIDLNVFGTGLGAALGLVLGAEWFRFLMPTLRMRPVPILLVCAFLAYRLFPYVPSLDLHEYWDSLKPVAIQPHWDIYAIARYALTWLLVAALGQALVGAARARRLLAPAVLCVLGAQVAIMHNSVSANEIVGAAAAWLCWLALGRVGVTGQSLAVAAALAAFVIAQRLQPFHFLAHGHAFGWIPFAAFMHGSMAVNTQAFLEKFFFYGGLIWLLERAGCRLGAAGLGVALGLLATSLAETRLPGRSAEITDAVLAVLITGLFALLARTLAAALDTGIGRRLKNDSNGTAAYPRTAARRPAFRRLGGR